MVCSKSFENMAILSLAGAVTDVHLARKIHDLLLLSQQFHK